MTAGISELLVQSHEGYIELLPALPGDWNEGNFKGVCAREGFELDFTWVGGKIIKVSILSKAGKTCRLRANLALKSMDKKLKISSTEPGLITFATVKGQRYELVPLGK
jgi:alpha-L-fucosidase 2